MAVGKTILYIDSALFGSGTRDNFRLSLNKFWHNQRSKNVGTVNTQKKYIQTQKVKYSGENNIAIAPVKHTFGDLKIVEEAMWTEEVQTMRLYAEDGEFETDTDWRNFVLQRIKQNTTYHDHVHLVDVPMTENELLELNSSTGIQKVSVVAEYVFYAKEYEQSEEIRNMNETAIPAMFSYASVLANSSEPTFADNMLASGKLKEDSLLSITKENDFQKYFKEFSKVASSTDSNQKLENVYFTGDNILELQQLNSKKYTFPMFAEISFSTDAFTQFSNLMIESHLSADFVSALHTSFGGSFKYDFQKSLNYPKLSTLRRESSNIFDINEWFQNYDQNGPMGVAANASFQGRQNRSIQNTRGELTSFSEKLNATIFMGKLRNYIKTRSRSFKDMMAGQMAQSETVAYRVAKYVGNASGTPIQNFWFLNDGDLGIIDFIDTQLKYNQRYSYEIYAYNFVMGNEYEYKKLAISRSLTEDCVELIDVATGQPVEARTNYQTKENQITGNTTAIPLGKNYKHLAEFDIVSRPSLKVIETMVYAKSFDMIDSPPLPPNMDIHSYIGIKDRVKLQLEAAIGEFLLEPILIENNTTQTEYIRKVGERSNISFGQPILFSNDDYPIQYEIFRTDKKPQRYSDFSGNRRARIDLQAGNKKTTSPMTATAFVDKIETNKKYYYTARCTDVHNNLSNPGPVHEIEMVEDKGATYLVHRVIELVENKPHDPVKSMRRFLYFTPTVSQTLIDETASGFDELSSAKDLKDKIILGQQSEAVWNKDFKMRITSKKTGRKIDINLNFKTRHIRSDAENE